MSKTLREIIEENPDLLDYPIAVVDRVTGTEHKIGAKGYFSIHTYIGAGDTHSAKVQKVLVFGIRN